MTTIETSNLKTEILGYTVPWIVSAGEKLEVKVSTNQPAYSHKLKRLIQGTMPCTINQAVATIAQALHSHVDN
jgi:siroheme synthase (precorrin-2 oxidase/ferrochelatase)